MPKGVGEQAGNPFAKNAEGVGEQAAKPKAKKKSADQDVAKKKKNSRRSLCREPCSSSQRYLVEAHTSQKNLATSPAKVCRDEFVSSQGDGRPSPCYFLPTLTVTRLTERPSTFSIHYSLMLNEKQFRDRAVARTS